MAVFTVWTCKFFCFTTDAVRCCHLTYGLYIGALTRALPGGGGHFHLTGRRIFCTEVIFIQSPEDFLGHMVILSGTDLRLGILEFGLPYMGGGGGGGEGGVPVFRSS